MLGGGFHQANGEIGVAGKWGNCAGVREALEVHGPPDLGFQNAMYVTKA